nr:unnamed protein product [Naegleria fowleri]
MIQNTGHRENKDLLISQCIEFIVNVGVLLIDCDRNQLKTQFRSLEKREIISLFLFENAYPALYLQKSLRVEHQRLEDSEHQLGEEELLYDYNISSELEFKENSWLVCFIKTDEKNFTDQLLEGKKLTTLLQVVELNSQRNPFQNLNSYLSFGFEPYLSALEKRNEKRISGSVLETIKSLRLEISHQCQSFSIPELNVFDFVHSDIKDLIKKGATLDSLSDKITKLKNETKVVEEISKMSLQLAQEIRVLIQRADVSQEIKFWSDFEKVLSKVDQGMKSQEIIYTLHILKNTRRMQAFTALNTTGIEEMLMRAKECSSLMQDLPISEFLSAKDIDKITATIAQMFTLLNKSKIYQNKERNQKKTENGDKLEHVGLQKRIEEIRNFRVQHEELRAVIEKVFLNTMSDQRETSVLEQVNKAFEELKALEDKIFDTSSEGQATWKNALKSYHEKIDKAENVIARKLSDHLGVAKTASEMFRIFSKFNPLFYKPRIRSAIQQYQEQLVQRVKEDISKLEDKFKQHYSFSETEKMSKLRDLPSISGFVIWARQIENQLITYMKRVDDVFGNGWERLKILRKKDCLWGFNESLAEFMGVSFSLMQSKISNHPILGQISKQEIIGTALSLAFLELVYPDSESQWRYIAIESKEILKRELEKTKSPYGDIVPIAFELLQEEKVGTRHIEENNLRKEGERFKNKLNGNIYTVIERWNNEIIEKLFKWKIFHLSDSTVSVKGFIFEIMKNKGEKMDIRVNFDKDIGILIKEVRNMSSLEIDIRVKPEIKNVASEAAIIHPIAMSLMESLKTFKKTMKKIDDRSDIVPLTSKYLKNVYQKLSEGFELTWRSTKLEKYSKELYEELNKFSSNIHELVLKVGNIYEHLETLRSCKITYNKLESILSDIQKIVDSLALGGEVGNLSNWVKILNDNIETILLARLNELMDMWLSEFQSMYSPTLDEPNKLDEDFEAKEQNYHENVEDCSIFSQLNISKFEIEIKIVNRSMKVIPSVHRAQAYWTSKLSTCLSWICDLCVIQSDRYDKAFTSEKRKTFKYLLERVSEEKLHSIFVLVQKSSRKTDKYVQQWLQYQSMWDMDIGQVMSEFNELESWIQLLQDFSKAKLVSENGLYSKDFGPIVVNYRDVYEKLNVKFDDTLRQILLRVSTEMKESMKNVFNSISKQRDEIESARVERSTQDAIKFLGQIKNIKKQFSTWEFNIKLFKEGEKLIIDYNCKLPEGWIFSDNVESEWKALRQIADLKNESVRSMKDQITKNLLSEEKKLFIMMDQFSNEWKLKRPLEGNVEPQEALKQLDYLESKLSQLKREHMNICTSREALDMDILKVDKLDAYSEELQNLKDVWTSVHSIWTELNILRDQAFNSIICKTVHNKLTELIERVKKLNPWMLTYSSVENLITIIEQHLKEMAILRSLKEECMKERHWIELRKLIGANWVLTQLTLGDIWDCKILSYEKIVRAILEKARGEFGLEIYLSQSRDLWNTMKFDLTNYSNKCYLVKSWDEVSTQIMDNLKTFSSMRNSPFFKAFEDECSSLETKVNRMRVLCDVLSDVQRVWVYLEGVFSGNVDIQYQLPKEAQRFQSIEHEFVSLMRKIHANPLCSQVINIPNVVPSLEKLSEQLNKLQKSLGEYLEKQRAAFPRFYFVGDEDLLEIIGNSNDPQKLQKHLKKMFSGISSLEFRDHKAISMCSRESEIVKLENEIPFNSNDSVHVFLANLEEEMRHTLGLLMDRSIRMLQELLAHDRISAKELANWMSSFPTQVIVTSAQVCWTFLMERQLQSASCNLFLVYQKVVELLENLTDMSLSCFGPENTLRRKKCEQLINELVHQKTVTKQLITSNLKSNKNFDWLYHMRFYWNEHGQNVKEKLVVKIANAEFYYGFEYLGVLEKLVQTPLTDKCYLALTQALHSRLGGSPFGPAGTGKTETVKSLGAQLARFVLVFNCDDTFDSKAMGRIFLGLCQCGAWGCFDEFNRLNEKIMSAVSQQIQTIQTALRDRKTEIELIGKRCSIHEATGIFITMNPGYAGRSNLPDNLKQLFRSVAMVKPDKELIAQVILYSQGFKDAESLARKTVLFFDLCRDELSQQSHYDFGLRALKSVLINAGYLKRNDLSNHSSESKILIQSIQNTIIPKLVGRDVLQLASLVSNIFPGVDTEESSLQDLKRCIIETCNKEHLLPDEKWMSKLIQLYNIQTLHHGFILVGPSASAKSTTWKVLLKALENYEGISGKYHVIDPKALTKDELYGRLDPVTREWTDGVFTNILRKIINSQERSTRHWIIFDGDVDPDWVENLNSVLDDNKLFTLPNGERLALTENVRIVFETHDLKYATMATVSRCGMIFFNDDILTEQMIVYNYLQTLSSDNSTSEPSQLRFIQQKVANIISPFFHNFITKCISFSKQLEHVMEYSAIRSLTSLFSFINESIKAVQDYNFTHLDFPMSDEVFRKYISNRFLFATLWAFSSSCNTNMRKKFADFLISNIEGRIDLPSTIAAGKDLTDFEVNINDGEWIPFSRRVPKEVFVDDNKILGNSMIPTLDTVRNDHLVETWIHDRKPIILCGPPGSGKTFLLTSVLKSLSNVESCFLNFSSATTSSLILKSLELYCKVTNTPNGLIMHPNQNGKWLIVFCDEINLPTNDNYGTQRVITFMRQLIEHGGFWRYSDLSWIKLERIMFVGSCNPPTDSGRTSLSLRFMRHCPLLFVDFPEEESLKQIYRTFLKAILHKLPNLSQHVEPSTKAMVEFYLSSRNQFTTEQQLHYIYSPRELSRWIRALQEGLKNINFVSLDDYVRLLAHEGLRIFSDRLVSDEERQWTDRTLDSILLKHFPMITESALQRPIMFCKWLSNSYNSVEKQELKLFLEQKLKLFSEEEYDVHLVLFDSVMEHMLRIDRVLKQPLGHLLLCGHSGTGRALLARFCAWMNDFSVFQIKAHKNYGIKDFEEDLRKVLRRSGCKDEKICFIFDESNILKPSFLEYMNSLLASGEVPGLFEADEYTNLINMCKDAATMSNVLNLDTPEEIYQWFVTQVQKNLHIVFTINPANADFKSRAATSPALFNRCVIDWFGSWPYQGLQEIASSFTSKITKDFFSKDTTNITTISDALVQMNYCVEKVGMDWERKSGKKLFLSPRHFLDFIKQLDQIYWEKRKEIQEQQTHTERGLKRLKDTEDYVISLQNQLKEQEVKLHIKNAQAKEKLDQIVENQKDAENKKQQSILLSQQLEEKSVGINKRKTQSQKELDEVQPLLLKSREEVKKIEAKHIQELRAFNNPPPIVKKALEAVIILLSPNDWEKSVPAWQDIKKVVSSLDFITNIRTFEPDANNIPRKLRVRLQQQYLDDPNLEESKVFNASKACGPLILWLSSCVKYSDIVEKIAPLKAEVLALEKESEILQEKEHQIQQVIRELKTKINEFTNEYTMLVQETKSIEMEINIVKSKVIRSKSLIESLSQEATRWSEQIGQYHKQQLTLLGDSILSAAFLAYSGFFDEQNRKNLMYIWVSILTKFNIEYKENINLVDYLSTPQQRLNWESNKLSVNDEISLQNAVILERFNKFPLIIDPTGQATEFIYNYYRPRNIIKTSFTDDSFMKSLENAMRFGTPLLVTDAEHVDPILNPVLNRHVKKVGGRNIVNLGNQDIDLSPTFVLILTTRDPSHQYEPDLSSRVTFVNFSVTPSSLRNQCLSAILQKENPEIDIRRSEQLKLQGEYKAKLRELENTLLSLLSSSKGSILENETLVGTLEKLKDNSKEIENKKRESERVIDTLSIMSEVFCPLAAYCSTIYFTLTQLSEINALYYFSLAILIKTLNEILALSQDSVKNRVEFLSEKLFFEIYRKVSRSLLHNDRLTLAMKLAQIKIGNIISHEEKAYLLEDLVGTSNIAFNENGVIVLGQFQRHMMEKLQKISPFRNIVKHLEEHKVHWKQFILEETTLLPDCFEPSHNPIIDAYRRMMVVKTLKPELLVQYMKEFIGTVFGRNFLELDWNISSIVEHEADKFTPLILASVSGYDASIHIEELVRNSQHHCTSIAMGSIESNEQADRAISYAFKHGSWVLLKNVHLDPDFLYTLEKKLHSLKYEHSVHNSFRLFLTSEIHANINHNLLRMSYTLVFESSQGIKNCLSQTFSNLKRSDLEKPPVERAKLYMLVSWLHAVLQERLSYPPIGWSKKYEINYSDLKWSFDTVDKWVDLISEGRQNVKPETLPWKALHILLGESIYGGKIDNEYDQIILNSFIADILTPSSYESSFTLPGIGQNGMNFTKYDQILNAIETIPQQEPEWLGLPHNISQLTNINVANLTIRQVLKIKDMIEEDSAELLESIVSDRVTTPMVDSSIEFIQKTVLDWLDQLPTSFDEKLATQPTTLYDQKLYLFFKNEIEKLNEIYNIVKTDLINITKINNRKIKCNNYYRKVINDLIKGVTPSLWSYGYQYLEGITVNMWFLDFTQRLLHFNEIRENFATQVRFNNNRGCVWLGGLLSPEAYLTTLREYTATKYNIPLEKLELKVFDWSESNDDQKDVFMIEGLILQGCTWSENKLALGKDLSSQVSLLKIGWEECNNSKLKDNNSRIKIPLYHNSSRKKLLCSLFLKYDESLSVNSIYQRGTAIIAKE